MQIASDWLWACPLPDKVKCDLLLIGWERFHWHGVKWESSLLPSIVLLSGTSSSTQSKQISTTDQDWCDAVLWKVSSTKNRVVTSLTPSPCFPSLVAPSSHLESQNAIFSWMRMYNWYKNCDTVWLGEWEQKNLLRIDKRMTKQQPFEEWTHVSPDNFHFLGNSGNDCNNGNNGHLRSPLLRLLLCRLWPRLLLLLRLL